MLQGTVMGKKYRDYRSTQPYEAAKTWEKVINQHMAE
jgi:hypothetical protein